MLVIFIKYLFFLLEIMKSRESVGPFSTETCYRSMRMRMPQKAVMTPSSPQWAPVMVCPSILPCLTNTVFYILHHQIYSTCHRKDSPIISTEKHELRW